VAVVRVLTLSKDGLRKGHQLQGQQILVAVEVVELG